MNGMIGVVLEIMKGEGIISSGNASNAAELIEIIEACYPNNQVTFDLECIEGNDAYEGVFEYFAEASDGDLVSYESTSFYNYDEDEAGLRVTKDGRTVESKWEQSSDWVAEDFFSFLGKLEESFNLPGRFVCYNSDEYDFRAIYLPKNIAVPLRSILA